MVSDSFSLRRTWAILKKEFLQLRRDPSTLSMIVMIPIMQLMLFGYAINTDPKHMSTMVLPRDTGQFSRSILAGLKNSEYFAVDRETMSEKEAELALRQGKTQFVVTIPENFSRDVVRGVKPEILIEADATDPTATSGAIGAMNGIITTALQQDLKGPLTSLKGKEQPVLVNVHRLYNPEGFTRYNIVPGLMGVVLTMTGVMMTALALTRERERGTMENLLAMPVKPIEVMAGKIAPYVAIGYIQATIIVMAAWLLFGVPVLGSITLMAGVLLIFIICNLALGYTLSTGAQNQMQAMQMSTMIFLPSIMLSGFMFPFYGMPKWAQIIGTILPMTHFNRIVRGVMLKGNGFIESWPNIWPMMLFMVVVTVVAMKLYRKTLD